NFYDKIDKLRYIFLNGLASVEKGIGTEGGYGYDYGFIFSEDAYAKPSVTRHLIDGQFYDIPAFTDDTTRLSPTVHITKLAQCTTYASEVSSILNNCGIQCEKVTKAQMCLNLREGRLARIGHQFNGVQLRKKGKLYYIDVTADIMKRDAENAGFDVDLSKLDRNAKCARIKHE
ncbi:MAG: hypothetical protein FWD89_00235, partial [Firmicutes bacterium]|nr:hypothetical protein [Bacillota bacterium]